MATIELTEKNFKETVEKEGLVLIDWWATWCPPCRMFGPIFEAASEKHPKATFGKIDTEAQQELAQAFQIMSIPTLMVFRDQVLLYAQPGALPAEMLEEIITKAEALDMNEVRREIAEREKREGTAAE
jgi:thioredoxin 1